LPVTMQAGGGSNMLHRNHHLGAATSPRPRQCSAGVDTWPQFRWQPSLAANGSSRTGRTSSSGGSGSGSSSGSSSSSSSSSERRSRRMVVAAAGSGGTGANVSAWANALCAEWKCCTALRRVAWSWTPNCYNTQCDGCFTSLCAGTHSTPLL